MALPMWIEALASSTAPPKNFDEYTASTKPRLNPSPGLGAGRSSAGSMRRSGASPSRNRNQPVAMLAKSATKVGRPISMSPSTPRANHLSAFELYLAYGLFVPDAPMFRGIWQYSCAVVERSEAVEIAP